MNTTVPRIFALFVNFEPLGLVQLEAMCMGCLYRLQGRRLTIPPDLTIIPKMYGRLVPRNPAALARAMQEMAHLSLSGQGDDILNKMRPEAGARY